MVEGQLLRMKRSCIRSNLIFLTWDARTRSFSGSQRPSAKTASHQRISHPDVPEITPISLQPPLTASRLVIVQDKCRPAKTPKSITCGHRHRSSSRPRCLVTSISSMPTTNTLRPIADGSPLNTHTGQRDIMHKCRRSSFLLAWRLASECPVAGSL